MQGKLFCGAGSAYSAPVAHVVEATTSAVICTSGSLGALSVDDYSGLNGNGGVVEF